MLHEAKQVNALKFVSQLQKWRPPYAHHSQMILDGTFGVCTSCLLLFIALAQDGQRKGVPIAFFLFSAPTGNQATHAGYNTQILHKLLSKWQVHLSKDSTASFVPYVVITDTDTKERGALILVGRRSYSWYANFIYDNAGQTTKRCPWDARVVIFGRTMWRISFET